MNDIPVTISYPSVIVAAITSVVIGLLWYAPSLFGKQWSKLTGQNLRTRRPKNKMKTTYGFAALTSIITSYVLAHFLDYTQAYTQIQGLQTAFWLWLGFITPIQLMTTLFEDKPMKLYLINTGYQLTSLLAMSTILTLWQ